jgi:tetratricopeptide (TPR) repeat protein
MACPCRRLLLLAFFLLLFNPSLWGQAQVGSVAGELQVLRGDFPKHSILVELQVHGATINSVYADDQGRFGFSGLSSNAYHVVIKDEAYNAVDQRANLDLSISGLVTLRITLVPREDKKQVPVTGDVNGSNPYMVDPKQYNRHFPKKAVKEFEKGLEADRDGKKDDAIRHYDKAIEISPTFYPAHNNLGSDELSKSDLPAARKEFEKVVELNQSDAAAYFNLGNVCMLMGQLPDAQHFLEEGLRRQPGSALGQFLLGSLNIRTGKLPEAEHALRHAMELDPTMAQPHLQLVNLLLQQGRKADAVTQLHSFVTAFPASPFTGQAKQLLQRLEAPTPP